MAVECPSVKDNVHVFGTKRLMKVCPTANLCDINTMLLRVGKWHSLV